MSISTISPKYPLLVAVIARVVLFVSALFVVDNLIDFASYPMLLIGGGGVGIVLAALVTPLRITTRGVITLSLGLFLAFKLTLSLLLHIPPPSSLPSLLPVVIADHAELAGVFLVLLFISSVAIFRHRIAITVELFALVTGFVWLLAAHRDLRLDRPKFIASLAWNLHLEYLSTFLLLSALFLGGVVSYTAALSLSLSRAANVRATPRQQSRWSQGIRVIPVVIAMIGLWILGDALYRSMQQSIGSRAANGVGQERQEGLSPLNFHSAVGGTSQPAALVRLDGDYPQNPFGKRLYLRESALSQLGNNEMLIAPPRFDQDVSRVSPSQPFQRDQDDELGERLRLPQSVFLLAMNDSPFAIDYPLSFTQLQNPKPDRFKAAYRAISMAPTISRESLLTREVGDPRWSDEEKLHYTLYHPDYRYTEIAKKITKGITDKTAQAFAIADWFSKNVTYTLSPNHDVPEGGDPVEPFLFGDLRGYCVHFSHATVYLLRALGIPSRIATGYMTDLSQSKDGHLLLRMSDRHAWAEVFIEGAGWVPFDTYPERVESHADSPVDMKALEELMGMVGPDEEILRPSDTADERGLDEPTSRWTPPSPRYLGYLLAGTLLILAVVKGYLRCGWLLRRSYAGRLRASFRALLSILRDAGLSRHRGETYAEYEQRITATLGTPCLLLRPALLAQAYGAAPERSESIASIDSWRQHDIRALRKVLGKKNVRTLCSFASALAFLRGELS